MAVYRCWRAMAASTWNLRYRMPGPPWPSTGRARSTSASSWTGLCTSASFPHPGSCSLASALCRPMCSRLASVRFPAESLSHPTAISGPPCGENVLHLDSRGRQVGAIPISNDATGSGIAVDAQENVYLAYGAPAARFEKWSRTGVLLASWGNPTPTYSSPSPAGITLDSAGNLYVANTPQSVIEEFGPTGTLLRTWGFHGSYPGQFQHPGGIAVSPNGTIYVADTDNHRIQTMKP